MVEGMINYDLWFILCGYFLNNTYNTEDQAVLLFDPYYNELKQFRAAEFYSMWVSGEHEKNHVKKAFIAMHKLKNIDITGIFNFHCINEIIHIIIKS